MISSSKNPYNYTVLVEVETVPGSTGVSTMLPLRERVIESGVRFVAIVSVVDGSSAASLWRLRRARGFNMTAATMTTPSMTYSMLSGQLQLRERQRTYCNYAVSDSRYDIKFFLERQGKI